MSVKMKNATLQDLFTQIEKNSEYRFFYNNDEVDVSQEITINVEEKSIGNILNDALNGLPYTFKETENKLIIIERKASSMNASVIGAQQGKKVSGKVTDGLGATLPGVSVVVKGTTNGIITDNSGNYLLSNVPENGTLQFSFVGMKSQEILVQGKSSINVTLSEETVGIEEVIAIGYGTMKKSDLTGSVVQVKAQQFETQQAGNLLQFLTGTVSGVSVNNSTSASESASIEVRGPTSLNANNSPLIVLDGVIFNGNINEINPNDIESIDILKDASSAAVFGSR
jgi:hypothetical protein